MPRGVFVGLATLDVVNRVDAAPGPNEKVTAQQQFVAAGGPAAMAAVTFAALGGDAVLVTALGRGAVAELVHADLVSLGVDVVDAAPDVDGIAPVSTVTVTASTGDRSVVGTDAAAVSVPPPARLADVVATADVVLVDGHHPRLATAATARAPGAALVIDAGRWKPVLAELLPAGPDMVCSADLRAPGTTDSAATAAWLVSTGVPVVVTTHGAQPIRWFADGTGGSVPVPEVDVVDTLGAGDVFHGAYAWFRTDGALDLPARLAAAARIAAIRCSWVGPRAWLARLPAR